eukprot:gb/GFBE01040911.1/.p1 GENE.gb/GFBE01040911.1/~~gb/GFBE01040911.1/.p1  ORF type:complete len:418 (+),score=114.46 gb/GFBE01040911.1/:1-1254(+)
MGIGFSSSAKAAEAGKPSAAYGESVMMTSGAYETRLEEGNGLITGPPMYTSVSGSDAVMMSGAGRPAVMMSGAGQPAVMMSGGRVVNANASYSSGYRSSNYFQWWSCWPLFLLLVLVVVALAVILATQQQPTMIEAASATATSAPKVLTVDETLPSERVAVEGESWQLAAQEATSAQAKALAAHQATEAVKKEITVEQQMEMQEKAAAAAVNKARAEAAAAAQNHAQVVTHTSGIKQQIAKEEAELQRLKAEQSAMEANKQQELVAQAAAGKATVELVAAQKKLQELEAKAQQEHARLNHLVAVQQAAAASAASALAAASASGGEKARVIDEELGSTASLVGEVNGELGNSAMWQGEQGSAGTSGMIESLAPSTETMQATSSASAAVGGPLLVGEYLPGTQSTMEGSVSSGGGMIVN